MLSGQQFGRFPEQLQQHSLGFDAALAQALEQTAQILQGERHDSAKQAAQRQAQLKQSYVEHHRIDSLPADWVLEWELRFMLDEQITELLGSIQTSALNALP